MSARAPGVMTKPLAQTLREAARGAHRHEIRERGIITARNAQRFRGRRVHRAPLALRLIIGGVERHAFVGKRAQQSLTTRGDGVGEHTLPLDQNRVYHGW